MSKSRARSRSLPRGRTVDVVVAAAPARRKHFLALLAVIQKAKRTEASGFDAYWEAVAEVVEHGLFVDGGYETANEFFADVVKMPARSATRMMRVARYASPREEEKYGVALLDAALGYIEALTGGPVQGKLPVAFDKLRVPVVRDGEKIKVRLEAATVVEVGRARRDQLAPKKKVPRAPEEATLRAEFAKHPGLEEVDVRVVSGAVRLGPIPLGLVPAVAKALAAARVNAR